MSLRLKTILGIALIEISLLMVLIISGMNMLSQSNEKLLVQHAHTTVKLFASATKQAVLAADTATLDNLVEEILKDQDIKYIRIKDSYSVLAEGGEKEYLNESRILDESYEDVTDGIFDVKAKILEKGVSSGVVEMGLSTDVITRTVEETRAWTYSIAAFEVVLVALFSYFLGTYLTSQLNRLKDAAELIIKEGKPGHQLKITGNDEVASVGRAFNSMSANMKQNYSELELSISAQKTMIESAKRNQAITDSILSASLDALITIDQEGKVLEFNHVAEQIFGWTKEEIDGQPLVHYIIPEKYRDAHNSGIKSYLDTERSTIMGERLKLTALHKDGHSFPIEIVISPIESSEGDMFTAFIRDITERVEAEKKLKFTVQEKGNFLATMSHEIRTPMNALLGVLDLLKETSLNKKQKKLVNTGSDSGELLLTIINDILDFSRIESKKVELNKTNFDLHLLFKRSLNLLNQAAEDKGLTLLLNFDVSLPKFTKGDIGRLQQILINLINNSIKFTDSGTITIKASAITSKDNESLILKCSVKDEGIGIPEELQGTLFDEFSIGDQSYSRKHERTGLGLAICSRLVGLMDGEISVSSELDKGTTFTFSVLLGVVDELEQGANNSSDQALPSLNTRILLAEDNPANQLVIKSMLEYAGLQVDIVTNGQEAIDAIKSTPYHIILMDISMPVMDGLTATTKIRELDGFISHIPIIALTAHAMAGDREHFIETGMNDYLSKPLQKSDLLNCIAHWTSQQKPTRLAPKTAIKTVSKSLTQSTTDYIQPEEELEAEYVDESVLQQLARDTNPKAIPKLLVFYIRDAQEHVKLIMDAAINTETKKLEFEAHNLSSSAAAHGNMKLHHLARKIEISCQQQKHSEATEYAHELFGVADKSFLLLALRAKQAF